ncbi:hypothetical protein BJV77DRAFT_98110 [Russula vinacea]|nr:hypothetical protein BJV77DRAFT_98110 [Russula vinacea]
MQHFRSISWPLLRLSSIGSICPLLARSWFLIIPVSLSPPDSSHTCPLAVPSADLASPHLCCSTPMPSIGPGYTGGIRMHGRHFNDMYDRSGHPFPPGGGTSSRLTSRLAYFPWQNLVLRHSHLNVRHPKAMSHSFVATVVHQLSFYALSEESTRRHMLAALSANWTDSTATIDVGARPILFSASEQHSAPLPWFTSEPSGPPSGSSDSEDLQSICTGSPQRTSLLSRGDPSFPRRFSYAHAAARASRNHWMARCRLSLP